MSIWHLILLTFLIGFYLLPTMIAFARGHHQRAAILLTNLFLGWTALGWIAALIWSATAKQQPVILVPARSGPDIDDWRRQIEQERPTLSKFDQLNQRDRR